MRHPRRLERLRDEVEAGEDAYLDAVVKETLRLRPVLAARAPPADRADGDRRPPAARRARPSRPASTSSTAAPDIYPEPDAFRPERFLERPAGTYTWIPFGGGVRRCLGASFAQFEMKVVLRELVTAARAAHQRTRGRSASRGARSRSCPSAAARSWWSASPARRAPPLA